MTNESSRRRLTLTTLAAGLVIAVCLGIVGYAIMETRAAGRENEKTRVALCALRALEERTIEATNDFLAEHPQGVPGISRQVILRGQANRRETVEALGVLDCPPN